MLVALVAMMVMAVQSAYAQRATTQVLMRDDADIKTLGKEKTLLILTEPEDEKQVARLAKKDPDKLAAYQKEIKDKNDALIEGVKKGWKYSKVPIEVKASSAIKGMAPETLEQYMTIQYVSAGLVTPKNEGQALMFTAIGGKKQYWMHVVALPGSNLPGERSEGIRFAIQQIQVVFNIESAEARKDYLKNEINIFTPLLKEKTLLIDQELLDEKLDEAAIKSAYIYPVKIVSKKEIEEAIENQKPGVAYLLMRPTDIQSSTTGTPLTNRLSVSYTDTKVFYTQFIINIEDGAILTFSDPARFGGMFRSSNKKVTAKDLEEFVKSINGQK